VIEDKNMAKLLNNIVSIFHVEDMKEFTRIIYTCDLHGSNIAWKKFINAIKIYEADVAIIGGDLTGKFLVPIYKIGENKYRAMFQGKEKIISDVEINDFIENISNTGGYALVLEKDFSRNSAELENLLKDAMIQRAREWVKMAEESFKDSDVKFYMLPGNDDIFEVDKVIEKSNLVVNPEGRVVYIDDFHEMLSTGFTCMTPWKCPRDVADDVIKEKIEKMLAQVHDLESSIFNFHCPPYGTILDLAPHLDATLKPIVKHGQLEMIHVGSKAIFDAIKKYQPLLGLFGHIHEARGHTKIGRTLCINPGSEYSSGVLSVAVVNLENRKKGKVKSFWMPTAM
jgi:Icc-related predicted phosphoesterase